MAKEFDPKEKEKDKVVVTEEEGVASKKEGVASKKAEEGEVSGSEYILNKIGSDRSYTPIELSDSLRNHLSEVSPGCYMVPALVYGAETFKFTPADGDREISGCSLYYTNNFLYNTSSKCGYFFEKQTVPFDYFHSVFKLRTFPVPVIFEYLSDPHSKYPKLISFYTD